MDTPRFAYTFDWRPSEHAEVTRLLVVEQFRSGIGRLFRWIAFPAVAGALLLSAAAAAAGDMGPAVRLVPLALALLILLLGFGRLTGWLRAWQLRRSDPNVGHPFTFSFTDDNLTIHLKTLRSHLGWHGIHRVRETPAMLLFYYSPRAAYFLPKRAVGDELDGLREWIRDHLPDSVPFDALPGPSPND